MNKKEAIKYLSDQAVRLGLGIYWNLFETIDYDKLQVCVGGLTHHNFEGGLLVHTAEVLELCFSTINTLKLKIDEKLVYLAVIFHDIGKLWDYDKEYSHSTGSKWVHSNHRKYIHHITRSIIEFTKINEKMLSDLQKDEVIHAILAHHGNVNYGSPVLPQTDLAWLLHLCDSLSARLN